MVKAALFSVQGRQYAFLGAAGNGDLDRMKDLIGQGCSVNARDQVKFPCAHINSITINLTLFLLLYVICVVALTCSRLGSLSGSVALLPVIDKVHIRACVHLLFPFM